MRRLESTDTVVVGSGVSGILVALELVRAGRQVLVVERGGYKPHAEQLGGGALKEGIHEVDVSTAEHNHEVDPETPYDWDYLYAVGGSTLHWGGVTPRFLPADFELRTRYGVGVDWPIDYAELEPFYARAERALGVAAGEDAPYPRSSPPPLRPHPYSPIDELVRSLLSPYYPLPQARPTASIGGRPPCCSSGRCTLCPVDARYSALHTIADKDLWNAAGFRLLDRTLVARLRLRGRRVLGVECIDSSGERMQIDAGRVVLAANGFENPAILLRSGLDGPDVGRWLNDHLHRFFKFETRSPAGAGQGTTISTGISYAFADGDWRGERASSVVYPENRGLFMVPDFEEAVLEGGGKRRHRALRERFQHSLILDTLTEELPDRNRMVELSSSRDRFGLPLNRVRYPGPSPYTRRGDAHLIEELTRLLRPLGGTGLIQTYTYGGAHLLGTCRMGDKDSVVNAQERHHEMENLYITGGSSFPTYSAVHPTLTIAALAIRLGEHLAAAGR